MFIKIEKNPDGSHAIQVGGNLIDGWAVIPIDMVLPNSFPYVNIEVADVYHPAIIDKKNVEVDGELVEKEIIIKPECTQLEVISMIEGEETLIEEPDIPSQLDIIEAQVTYTALMTDTLLEV